MLIRSRPSPSCPIPRPTAPPAALSLFPRVKSFFWCWKSQVQALISNCCRPGPDPAGMIRAHRWCLLAVGTAVSWARMQVSPATDSIPLIRGLREAEKVMDIKMRCKLKLCSALRAGWCLLPCLTLQSSTQNGAAWRRGGPGAKDFNRA